MLTDEVKRMTSHTMVERLARTMWGVAGNSDEGDKWRELIPVARTFIAAMREPTEAMVEAIVDVSPDRPHADYWRAGIDAALVERCA